MTRGCPICGKSPGADHRPFCSKRCADIDLARWLKGLYAIPGDADAAAEAADTAAEADAAATPRTLR